MSLTLLQHIKALWGNIEDDSGTIDDEARRIFRRSYGYNKDAVDGAAGTTTAAQTFYRANSNQKVISAYYLPRGAAAFNGANFGTVQLLSGDGTATPATLVGSVNTETVSMADGVSRALTLVVAEQSLTAGDTLAFAITKDGLGVAIPAGELIVELEEE
jgi:hypothetical protein